MLKLYLPSLTPLKKRNEVRNRQRPAKHRLNFFKDVGNLSAIKPCCWQIFNQFMGFFRENAARERFASPPAYGGKEKAQGKCIFRGLFFVKQLHSVLIFSIGQSNFSSCQMKGNHPIPARVFSIRSLVIMVPTVEINTNFNHLSNFCFHFNF